MRTPLMLIIALFAPLIACGKSPLLHHEEARLERQIAAQQTHDEECPLEYPNSGLCASLTWESPPSSDESAFTLRFWSRATATKDGPFIDPAHTVFVQLWMPSMGHGSSPVTIAQNPDEPGVFGVTKVYFIMPGDWDIRVQLKQENAVVEQAIYRVEI